MLGAFELSSSLMLPLNLTAGKLLLIATPPNTTHLCSIDCNCDYCSVKFLKLFHLQTHLSVEGGP